MTANRQHSPIGFLLLLVYIDGYFLSPIASQQMLLLMGLTDEEEGVNLFLTSKAGERERDEAADGQRDVPARFKRHFQCDI